MNNKNFLLNFVLVVVLYFGLKLGIDRKIIDAYFATILISIFISIILAVSLNLTTGFLGQLALGHAGFMAVGAYTSAIFTKTMALPPTVEFLVAILLGGLFAAVLGFLIGIPTLRLRGDYLAIITLGFGEIIRNVIINLNITGGARGYRGIPKYTNFNYVFWVMVLTIYVVATLIRSRHGRAIISIREDEIAAEASGINTTYYKLLAFTVAAFFAGIAGALYAHYYTVLEPKTFGYSYSIEMVIIVVLGGMGSITGSIISAFILTSLPQVLLKLARYRMLVYSIILIVIMLFKPSGLLGKYEFSMKSLLNKLLGKSEEVK